MIKLFGFLIVAAVGVTFATRKRHHYFKHDGKRVEPVSKELH